VLGPVVTIVTRRATHVRADDGKAPQRRTARVALDPRGAPHGGPRRVCTLPSRRDPRDCGAATFDEEHAVKTPRFDPFARRTLVALGLGVACALPVAAQPSDSASATTGSGGTTGGAAAASAAASSSGGTLESGVGTGGRAAPGMTPGAGASVPAAGSTATDTSTTGGVVTGSNVNPSTGTTTGATTGATTTRTTATGSTAAMTTAGGETTRHTDWGWIGLVGLLGLLGLRRRETIIDVERTPTTVVR